MSAVSWMPVCIVWVTSPKTRFFYGVDLDEVIRLRRQRLTPLPNETPIGASMFDAAWLDDLVDQYTKRLILFIAEGVMMYFNKADNQHFCI